MMSSRGHSLLLVLLLVWRACVEGLTCEFPSYLQDVSGGPAWWLYHVTHAGAQLKNNTIVYVEVYAGHISTTPLSWNQATIAPLQYERECVEKHDGDTYLVKHLQRGEEPQYLCLQFVKRSSHVVQIAVSENVSESLNCTEVDLEVDPWPLIRFDDRANETLPCPLHGGYDLEILDTHNHDRCTDHYFVPRYECGCRDATTIHLDLRSCLIGNSLVGMEQRQDLTTIATWDDGDFRFAILKRPRLGLYWTLRVPKMPSPRMTGYISADVVCSSGQIQKYSSSALIVNLNERLVASVCADVSPHCSPEVCNDSSLFSELYCESTCGYCENAKKSTCHFPPSARGTWQSVTDLDPEFTISGDQVITRGGTKMVEDLLGGDQDEIQPCVAHNAAAKTYLLLKFDRGGCSPQYICLTVKPIAPSVIRYNLSAGPSWDPLFKPTMCYTSHHYNSLVQEARFSLAVMKDNDGMVSCEVPGPAYAVLIVSNDGSACHGRLSKPDCLGSSSGELLLDYDRCLEEEPRPARRFACLAQLPVFSARRLVLIRDVVSGEVLCLSFPTDMSNFELLPGTKCRGGFNQKDILTTLQVSHELSSCTPLANTTRSPYINYTMPVVHSSFFYSSSTAKPDTRLDPLGTIRTVKPYMAPDRSNLLDRTNTLDTRDGRSRNYYRSSAHGHEEKAYGSPTRGSESYAMGNVDCSDKQNADVSDCQNVPVDNMDRNRTKRKKVSDTRVNSKEHPEDGSAGVTAKQTNCVVRVHAARETVAVITMTFCFLCVYSKITKG